MEMTGTVVKMEHIKKQRNPQYAGQVKGVTKKSKTFTKNADCEKNACGFGLSVLRQLEFGMLVTNP